MRRPAVWSNFFYLVPLIAALVGGLWLTAVAVAALFVFSLAFHYSRERRFVRSDIAAAIVVALFCVALVFSGGFLQTGYMLLAALLIFIGLYIRLALEHGKRSGPLHAVWHMVAAALILACILSAA